MMLSIFEVEQNKIAVDYLNLCVIRSKNPTAQLMTGISYYSFYNYKPGRMLVAIKSRGLGNVITYIWHIVHGLILGYPLAKLLFASEFSLLFVDLPIYLIGAFFLSSEYFYYAFMKGLKKAGYKGSQKRVKHADALEYLLNVSN